MKEFSFQSPMLVKALFGNYPNWLQALIMLRMLIIRLIIFDGIHTVKTWKFDNYFEYGS